MHGQTKTFTQSVARTMRKAPTDAERRLWQHLRVEQLGVRFRRQHPYGRYILDFVCLERQLVIEVDGSQHMERQDYDDARTGHLREAGFQVLRFDNLQVLNETSAVLQVIYDILNPSPPQPSP